MRHETINQSVGRAVSEGWGRSGAFFGSIISGTLLGLFADASYYGGSEPFFMDGLFLGGGTELFVEQLIANVVTIGYAFVVTTLIMLALKATIGVRVSEETEASGLDLAEHAETAYHGGAGLSI